MTSNDKEFVAATIQAIGRCASNIEEVSEACLTGLMSLVSHRDGQNLIRKLKHIVELSICHYRSCGGRECSCH